MAPRKKKEEQPGHVIRLNGKEYITHIGLLDKATKAGMQGWETVPVFEWSDPASNHFVVRCRVWDNDGREFSGIGDANPGNLNSMIASAAPRMAETRAINRALRALINHGGTTADEMPLVGLGSQVIEEPKQTAQKAAEVKQAREDAEKWWLCIQSQMLACPGLPTPDEVDEMCQVWSKGKLKAEDCSTVRLENLIKKIAEPDGQELLHQIRERHAIQAEGAE
jgi:hypothetical protein